MIGVIIVFLIFVSLYWYQAWFDHQKLDGRTFPNGKTHQYVIGDNLRLYGGGGQASGPDGRIPKYVFQWSGISHFFGLGMMLPKRVPQLYLDSRKGGGRWERYQIDESQRISLEGDFDNYFQLYAPKGSETLALSIITPDVMEVLTQVAGEYDIELYRDRLRIISRKPVFRHPDRQAELLKILEKLVIEIDQRMTSWHDIPVGEEPRLIMYPLRGFRIFGRYIPIGVVILEVLWSIASLLFLGLAMVLFWYSQEPQAGWALLILAGVFCLLLAWTHTMFYKRSRFKPYD